MPLRLFSAVILLVLLSAACGSAAATPTPMPQEKAWYACTAFIQKTQGLSALDAQDYTASNVTALGGDRYEVKVNYAKYNAIYKCSLSRHANGDWELLDLSTLQ